MAIAKPSGLKITRDQLKYTLEWKVQKGGSDAQQMQWYGTNGWTSVNVGKTTTSKAVTLVSSQWYPNTNHILDSMRMRVRGNLKGKKGWSGWKENKLKLSTPKPTLTATWDSNQTNVCVFAWEVETSDSDSHPFVDVQWESVLIEGYNAEASDATVASLGDWSSLNGYQSGTGTASDSETVTESSAIISTGTHTRIFRCRGRGPAGASSWTYATHTYAKPYETTITNATATEKNSITLITAEWTVKADYAYPIDDVTVQCLVATPGNGLTVPAGANWTDLNVSADAGSAGAAVTEYNGTVGDDECLWVRVNTSHDASVTNGKPHLVSKGKLTSPSNLSVSIGAQTTVTCDNNSNVPDSFLAVKYCTPSDPDGRVVGVIPHGSSSVTINYSAWETDRTFAVYAVQGSSTQIDGTSYSVIANMTSDSITDGGNVPVAPSISAVLTDGGIKVSWDYPWAASGVELSWAESMNAWESTEEPDDYEIDGTPSSWIISVNAGTWYVRVRLVNGDTIGPWSDIATVTYSVAPIVPVLNIEKAVIAEGEEIACSWTYTSADGTPQALAEIKDENDNILASTKTDGVIAFTPSWNAGENHYLSLRVASASGQTSGWSDGVSVVVANPVTASVDATSLETITVTDSDGNTRSVTALTTLPLHVESSGGEMSVKVIRAADYHVARPDETEFNGYAGEIIATMDGDDVDIYASFDDSAQYTLIVTATDALGQTDTAEVDFEVYWATQATVPSATVTMSDGVAIITPDRRCDIYRLSADKPVLIYEQATAAVVDPYPATGYRVVNITSDGDYITASNDFAWVDVEIPAANRNKAVIVNYDEGAELVLPYNISISHDWAKQFESTRYLNGSVQGDWDATPDRSGSITVDVSHHYEQDVIYQIHDLAVWDGLCHLRLPDLSSFSCNIDVSESAQYGSTIHSYTLKYTRVDGGLDGVLLTDWEDSDG